MFCGGLRVLPMSEVMAVHRTPLHDFHVEQGGRMVEFAGWEMPMTYAWPVGGGGLVAEHHQVRNSGGLFDVSHMGRVRFKGRHARKLIERACTRKIGDMQNGQCRYSLVCNEQGGVKDDVIVMRIDDDEFLVVVNASNREKLLAHFEQIRAGTIGGFGDGELNCKIDDETLKTAMVALQGPKVMDLISRVSKEVPSLKRYRFAIKNLVIMKLIVSRTGYTGEDGVEVILPKTGVGMAMKLLLKDAGLAAEALVRPAGLGARDTLRTEAGMPLYGHELGEEINALSCGVDFAISLDKGDDERCGPFIGMQALRETAASGGPRRKLVGMFVEGKRSARQGMTIRANGKEVGVVTSGCPSPTLERCIAMGFVDTDQTPVGTKLMVDTGKGELAAEVTSMPFYSRPKAS